MRAWGASQAKRRAAFPAGARPPANSVSSAPREVANSRARGAKATMSLAFIAALHVPRARQGALHSHEFGATTNEVFYSWSFSFAGKRPRITRISRMRCGDDPAKRLIRAHLRDPRSLSSHRWRPLARRVLKNFSLSRVRFSFRFRSFIMNPAARQARAAGLSSRACACPPPDAPFAVKRGAVAGGRAVPEMSHVRQDLPRAAV